MKPHEEQQLTASQEAIRDQCRELGEFLICKNRSYGNSALNPLGIFAPADAELLIRTRLDDKLNRIANNAPDDLEDNELVDLAGYLVLLMIIRNSKKEW